MLSREASFSRPTREPSLQPHANNRVFACRRTKTPKRLKTTRRFCSTSRDHSSRHKRRTIGWRRARWVPVSSIRKAERLRGATGPLEVSINFFRASLFSITWWVRLAWRGGAGRVFGGRRACGRDVEFGYARHAWCPPERTVTRARRGSGPRIGQVERNQRKIEGG